MPRDTNEHPLFHDLGELRATLGARRTHRDHTAEPLDCCADPTVVDRLVSCAAKRLFNVLGDHGGSSTGYIPTPALSRVKRVAL